MAIDMKVFIKNRSEIQPESLVQYAGQWVAWSPDGTHIVAASAESDEAVMRMIKEAGLDLEEHVLGYLPALDEHIFGLTSLYITFPEGEGGKHGGAS